MKRFHQKSCSMFSLMACFYKFYLVLIIPVWVFAVIRTV
jgi:hypothetical protein